MTQMLGDRTFTPVIGYGGDFPVSMAGGARPAADAHTRIHRGEFFRSDRLVASLANDDTINLIMTTGTEDAPHVVGISACNGSSDYAVYEAPTYTGGTANAIVNHKLTSTTTSPASVLHSPTISDVGVQVINNHIAGGTGPHAGGSTVTFDNELILKPETSYLFRLTNRAGGAKRASLTLLWYSAPVIPDA